MTGKRACKHFIRKQIGELILKTWQIKIDWRKVHIIAVNLSCPRIEIAETECKTKEVNITFNKFMIEGDKNPKRKMGFYQGKLGTTIFLDQETYNEIK